ncbi:Sterile alpha motif domain-containing protein 13 [Pseudolycoriella hygida]|uniref:Sterile alpha motif domain-containing protein 13 n=1 Tax=Pseudolycoriella hygida TaxID=35572 RepID=A0A9Q0NGQ2_9DIPT|nr:Sterile alpha motif domain-containing protein 13 [Pseudolycoriella hygida]
MRKLNVEKEKVKRTKRTEDPEESQGSRSKRTRTQYFPLNPTTKRRTTYSFQDTTSRYQLCSQCEKGDELGKFTTCSGNCTSKIHLSCLEQISPNSGQQLSWRCKSCQYCAVCKKAGTIRETLLKCFTCCFYYHRKCHGNHEILNCFQCHSCNLRQNSGVQAQTQNDSISNDSIQSFCGFKRTDLVPLPENIIRTLSETIKVELPAEKYSSSTIEHHDNSKLPNASEWTVNEVYNYFKEKFPRYAYVFKDEEIDGKILYKINRDDMRSLKLKLGPTIEIYDHIREMQLAVSQINLTV